MSDWTIKLAGRPSDPLNERSIFDLSNALEGEDRDICRELYLHCLTSGVKSVGAVARGLEQLSHHERRRLLDILRRRVGLDDTKTVEQQREYKAANEAGAVRASMNSGWQICHGKNSDGQNCNAIPMSSLGVPCETPVRKWFCEAHRDQARPGDMEPRGSGLYIGPSGVIKEIDEAEQARAAAEAESRRAQLEAEAATREPEAEAARAHAQARAEELASLLPWNQARR
jgi:hypothetical protein